MDHLNSSPHVPERAHSVESRLSQDVHAAPIRLLAFGLAGSIAQVVESLLPVEIMVSPDEAALSAGLTEPDLKLLVIVSTDMGVHYEAILRRIRQDFPANALPVVYGLGLGTDDALMRRLVHDLGVRKLLGSPFDAWTLAAALAPILDVPLPAPADRFASAVAVKDDIVEGFIRSASKQMSVLQDTVAKLMESGAPRERRIEAADIAYRLAAALHTQKMNRGSTALREAAGLLSPESALDGSQLVRLCNLVMDAEEVLRLSDPRSTPIWSHADPPLILLLTSRHDLTELVEQAFPGRVWSIDPRDGTPASRAAVSPLLTVVDFLSDVPGELLMKALEDSSRSVPPNPVLVLADLRGTIGRIQVARLGARGLVSEPDLLHAIKDGLRLLDLAAPKTLVVDDEASTLEALAGALSSAGLQVVTLSDPLEFIHALNRHQPDVVVLDAQMPFMDGLDLIKWMRADPAWKSLPAIALIPTPAECHRALALQAGADDFIAKPVGSLELITRTRHWMEVSVRHRSHVVQRATPMGDVEGADETIKRLLSLARREGLPLSLVALDVDELATINARYGVVHGNALLQRLEKTLLKALRYEDVVVRLGGDEFVLALVGAKKEDAAFRVQFLLRQFRDAAVSEGEDTLHPGVTGAVAEYPGDGADLATLYKALDRALSVAKTNGGNQIMVAAEGPAVPMMTEVYDVVVVDGDQGVTDLLERALRTKKYRSRVYRTGEEALAELLDGHITVRARTIVVDLDLPGMDGLAVLRSLAEHGIVRRSRILVLSDRSTEEDVLASFEYGAFDHIAKPFSLPVLMQRILRALRG
jgi:diguanylate cyclase (GGDEF)-like protein